jgi:hypothetical protein
MKIQGQAKLELNVTISLTEEEARALEALSCYGDDAFVRVFYRELGETYMKPHERGLRSLLNSVRSEMPIILERSTKSRKVFYGAD